jgi:6-phosphogluconolactonase (cycloisomerase 2 family)
MLSPFSARTRRVFVLVLAISFIAFSLAACGGGGSQPAPPPTLTSISVSPSSPSVALGATQQLSATGSFSNGTTQPLAGVQWSSSNTAVATVSSAGLLTAVAQGSSVITAAFGSATATVNVTVGPPVLASVSITPANATLALGRTQQLSAVGVLTDKTTQPLTNITWVSSAPQIASVSSTGLVTSKAVGSATISASASSVSGSTGLNVGPAALESVTVSPDAATVPVGLTQQFTASGGFSDGTSSPLATVTWAVSDTSIATISATGVLTAKIRGNVTVSASSSGVSGSTLTTVGAPVLTAIAVSPQAATTALGAAPAKFTATGTFSDQTTQEISTSVQWTLSNPFTTTVDASGVATATRPGVTRVIASSGGVSGNAELTTTATPRYLYMATDSGRTITRTTIEASTGLPRFEGYQVTGIDGFGSFPCITTDPFNEFAYMANVVNNPNDPSVTGQISQYTIDQANGTLTRVSPAPFPVSVPLSCIQFEPTGKFAYAAAALNNTQNQLVTFSRDAVTGRLTQINSIALPLPPSAVAIDPLGKFLYVNTVFLDTGIPAQAYGFQIDPTTGALTPVQGTPFTLPNIAGSFTFGPSGDFLYMSNTNGTSIDTYTIDRSTGKLTAIAAGTVNPCVNPSALQFVPGGKSAYITCSIDNARNPHSASITSFSVAADGKLTQVGSASTGDGPLTLTVDPSGKFAYVGGIAGYAYAYQIDSNGVATNGRQIGTHLTPISLEILSGSAPVAYNTKAAFVTSTTDNTLTSYAVAADGTFNTPQSITTGLAPFSLSGLIWGSDLLLATGAPVPNLTAYNVGTGVPASQFQFGDAATAGGVVIDPSGNAAFETDSANGVIYTYVRVGTAWGQLITNPPGLPPVTNTPAGSGAGPMIVDPSGRFLYVGNRGSNSISAYQYPSTSPQLSEAKGNAILPHTGGSPYSLTGSPLQFAIDPVGAFLYVLCSDQNLRVFSIDYSAGGFLTPVATAGLSGLPLNGLALSVDGKFIYLSGGSGTQAFSVNPNTGALTAIALSGPVLTNSSSGVYADPSGKLLYVTTPGTPGSVYAFTINADGTLTQVGTTPVATVNGASSVAFTADVK